MTDARMIDYMIRIFSAEGGYTNDPDDPGNWTGGKRGKGECKGTKYGISASAYPSLDIAALTFEDAEALYDRDYWNAVSGHMLPNPLAFQVFDAAVQHGPKRATLMLQESLNVVVDGRIGPVTMTAILAAHPTKLALRYYERRMRFYTSLPKFKTYATGWMNRMAQNAGYLARDAA